MNGRSPKKITRRLFLSTSGKAALGTVGILAGITGLLYYRSAGKRGTSSQKLPPGAVDLGETGELTGMRGARKITYEYDINIGNGQGTISREGFVYIKSDANGELLIMSPLCPHLGCSVEPESESGRGIVKGSFFLCPCHGAEFDESGNAVGGVVLQGLDTYKPIIANGRVYIDISSPIKGRISSGT